MKGEYRVKYESLGVSVAFEPETYMVTEGNQRDLRVVVRGSFGVPVEVLVSTTDTTATGIATTSH